nr:pyridoxal-dependent decarboxylase [Hyphomonas sp. Mor2]
MSSTRNTPLEPEDWESFERLLIRLASEARHALEHIGESPVWQRPPQSVRDAFNSSVPMHGEGIEAVYDQFKRDLEPFVVGNRHPNYLGWVIGSGIPASMIGDWLAALVNSVPTLFDDSSALTELQVLRWIKQLVGMPADCSAILTTGVSESTLIALRVATYAALGDSIRLNGVAHAENKPVFYISEETHDCARKAIQILGFGSTHIRVLKTDQDFAMRASDLAAAIREDLAAGRIPVAVIATIGTVNTGACDDIGAIADVCSDHDVWLHVDGAFGIWSAITSVKKHLTSGIERADSLVFDLHKWMYQTYDVGCAIIQDPELHRQALETHADYLAPLTGSVRDGPADLCSLSIQLSRGFKALKIWFSLKSEGVGAFASAIERNLERAQEMTELIHASTDLELLAPTNLHIVNLRFSHKTASPASLNACNEHIVRQLQLDGIAVPSSTMINGKFSIRVCFSNHRANRSHVDRVVSAIEQAGRDYYA